MLGPLIGANAMERFKIDGVFYFMAAAVLLLALVAIFESLMRPSPEHIDGLQLPQVGRFDLMRVLHPAFRGEAPRPNQPNCGANRQAAERQPPRRYHRGAGRHQKEESYQHQVLGTFSLSNQPTLGSSVALSFRGLRGETGARASATPKFRSCG